MADFDIAYDRVVKGHEGGYWKGNGTGSGETYCGIDRKPNPQWPGWRWIDQYKAEHGEIPRYTLFANVELDAEVRKFYRNMWNSLINIDQVQNQSLFNALADFLKHLPYKAVKVINYVANSIQPGIATSNARVSGDVVALMNQQPLRFFGRFQGARKQFYLDSSFVGDNFSQKLSDKTVQVYFNNIDNLTFS